METVEEVRLTRRADALRVENKTSRRRGRPRLKLKDCVKRFGGIGRGVENEGEGWGSGE